MMKMDDYKKINEAYKEVLDTDADEKMNEATLTKKHFIALANSMKKAKTLDALKEDILAWLVTTNPAFDADRFRKAAGM